jgi:RND family efflux transporter MFP subunit
MNPASFTIRFITTLVIAAIAIIIAWQLWVYYMLAPWTRDGRVRADTVELAPDVSGPVVQVFVQDNQQVTTGEALFQIDPVRFTLALRQAQATLAKTKAAMQDAERNANRYASLSNNAVSGQSRDEANSAALEAEADFDEATANEATAELNLARSTVRATVNGTITNFSMRPGDYVNAGNATLAIVDTDSLYVDGYFEETKLRHIQIGDKALVTLLNGGPAITGHVAGFAAGIVDAERTASPNLLANVNPTFTWVRLAQRVPVRIALDHIPAGTRLIAGLTCTVSVQDK